MSLFYVIEAAFLLIIVFVFSIGLDLLSPFQADFTYIVIGLLGIILQNLLIKAKAKWIWMNKKIDPQFAVFLIIIILFLPIIIEMIMTAFGVEGL